MPTHDTHAGTGTPRVLALLGSPRPQSNTGVLLDGLLAGAAAAGAEVARVELRALSFRSCRHCRGCERSGVCVVEDDMKGLYDRMRRADHLVLASPIHFSGVSGEMKMMIDRGQAFWVERYVLKVPPAAGRRGVFLATCGAGDRRVFGWARHAVLAFLNSAGFSYYGELFEDNTDHPPPMTERVDVLARAEELGRRLVKDIPAAPHEEERA